VDCEKFDRVVLDLLYDELDELTAAAARRHMEHCARCSGIGSGLRATREVGMLPVLEPPADLESRILAAERRAHAELPLRQRIGRAVSVMAGYAMRPQLAMAALLVLVLASSLVLLRARPGDRDAMRVTERGVPEVEGEAVVVPVPEQQPAGASPSPPSPAFGAARERSGRSASEPSEPKAEAALGVARSGGAGAPAASRPEDESAPPHRSDQQAYDEALARLNARDFEEAQRDFEAIEARGGDNAASAALLAAQAVLGQSGCTAAVKRFEDVASRYPGISIGHEATWQAAKCCQELGQLDRARRHLLTLRATQAYAQRAQTALDALEGQAQGQTAVASRRAASRPAPAKAAPAKPASKARRARPPAAAAAEERPAAPKADVGF